VRPEIRISLNNTLKVLQNAAEHANEDGIREITPELMEKVRAAIRQAYMSDPLIIVSCRTLM
jgi:hypothetical protein